MAPTPSNAPAGPPAGTTPGAPPPTSSPASAIPRPGSALPASPGPVRSRAIRDTGAVRYDNLLATRWSVRGAAKVVGSADADAIEVDGPLSIGATLRVGSLSVRGPLEVVGSAQIEGKAEIHGSARFLQDLEAGELDIAGPLWIRGAARIAGLAHFRGDALLTKESRFGHLVGAGRLETPASITADRVALDIHADSTIGSILAGSVVVTRPPGLPFRLPLIGKDRPTLRVLRIDASEVALDGVSVEILRADRVTLGPNCHVARLLGEVVAQDPSSHVGPESRSPPPYGIRR